MTTRFRYRPIKQLLFSHELGHYISYGIRAFVQTPSGVTQAAVVFDVSQDPGAVAALTERCSRLQLHPIHLLDVVLDAIS